MTNSVIVSTVVDKTNITFDRLFDYSVPDKFADDVMVGKRVLVPFGAGNRKRQAMIVQIKSGDNTNLKQIDSVLDDSPILSQQMLGLAKFIKTHCFCTYYEAIKAMLPAGINYRVKFFYSLPKDLGTDLSQFSQEEINIVNFLQRKRKPVKEDVLRNTFGYLDNDKFDELVKKGILIKQEEAIRQTLDATRKMVAIVDELSDIPNLTPKQQQVIELLQTTGSVSVSEVCYFLGVTKAVVDGLVKKNILYYYEQEVYRQAFLENDTNKNIQKDINLTDEQTKAYNHLYSLYLQNKPSVSLLYGVTGSGKTSVFMKLVQDAHNDGKGVIVMVPEIALTTQLITLFRNRFGDDVAVLHSALSLGERLDEYKRLKKGIAKIAVGTRSAVFAPIQNLGLIIIDEEHEYTYKSEATPRFHARDIAKYLCTVNNCLLVLSSATPDVESFYNAKVGNYSFCQISQRYGKAVLPDVIVEDMNVELAIGNTTSFSARLAEELRINLENGKQSIILLNRRGHNTFVSCPNCKEVATCPNCSISLTYHSANNRMMCHYCGYSEQYSGVCKNCGDNHIRLSGMGTQRAEQELSAIFPDARILRMDADTTMAKFSHDKKLTAFANGEYDILIGTQMVAKGLNFPNVTLVGVLNADQILYSDNFRGYEHAFALLTQVVGRSGRGDEKGRAIIQTLTPDNTIISLAAQQNYIEFYNSEINIRKVMLYPPFANICVVGFVGKKQLSVVKCANDFSAQMAITCRTGYPDLPIRILGPSSALVSKVNNKYRYRLIIKCRNSKRFREMLNSLLVDFGKNKEFADVTVYADMNPVNF